MFLNLLDNAVKYCRPDDAIRVRLEQRPSGVLCEVWDSGPGIAAVDLPHVVERLYRGRTDVEGSGIGLAAARRIAVEGGAVVARILDESGTRRDGRRCARCALRRGLKAIPYSGRRWRQLFLSLRDQRRYTFINEIGGRCPNRKWLHTHHIRAVAAGGDNELANLRTLCSAHHRAHGRSHAARICRARRSVSWRGCSSRRAEIGR